MYKDVCMWVGVHRRARRRLYAGEQRLRGDYGIFADSPQGPRLGYMQGMAWSCSKPGGVGKMGPHCCGGSSLRVSGSAGLEQAHCRWDDHLGEASRGCSAACSEAGNTGRGGRR